MAHYTSSISLLRAQKLAVDVHIYSSMCVCVCDVVFVVCGVCVCETVWCGVCVCVVVWCVCVCVCVCVAVWCGVVWCGVCVCVWRCGVVCVSERERTILSEYSVSGAKTRGENIRKIIRLSTSASSFNRDSVSHMTCDQGK